MMWDFPPYAAIFAISTLLALLISLAAWRQHMSPGSGSFVALMAAMGIWSFGRMLEAGIVPVEGKITWAKIEYFGIAFIGTFWFLFALNYVGREQLLTRRYKLLMWVLPVLTLVAVWTNELHGLIWPNIMIVPGSHSLIFDHGAMFWLMTVYNYTLIMAGLVMLLRVARTGEFAYRRQTRIILVGAAVPLIGNVLYLIGIQPIPGLDLTPVFFCITGVLYSLTFVRFEFIDLLPVARSAIIENMADGVLVLDLDKRILDVNPSVTRILGLTKMTKRMDVREALEDFPRLLEACLRPPQQDQVITLQTGAMLDLQISDINDVYGRKAGRLIIMRDVTAQRQVQQRFFDLAVEQERVRLLRDFIQNASHELRTPLAIINTSLYLLGKHRADHLQLQQREKIALQVKRLDNLFNDMLTMTRLDTEQALSKVPVHIPELLALVQQNVASQFATKPQQIHAATNGSIPMINGDPSLLEVAFANVLQNARMYTPEKGCVRIETEAQRDGVSITIADNGAGMPPDVVAHIFERFYRADEAHSTPGFGLGLSIAKAIFDKHGGQIDVTSTVGQGSTFHMWLPAAPAAH